MKYLVGFISIFVVLALAIFLILKQFGIVLFDEKYIYQSMISLAILAIATVLLIILIPFFFKNNFKQYNTNVGNVAKPKL